MWKLLDKFVYIVGTSIHRFDDLCGIYFFTTWPRANNQRTQKYV